MVISNFVWSDIIRRKFMPKRPISRPPQTKEFQIKLRKLKLCCHSGIKRKFNAYSRVACSELPQFCNECSPIAGQRNGFIHARNHKLWIIVYDINLALILSYYLLDFISRKQSNPFTATRKIKVLFRHQRPHTFRQS